MLMASLARFLQYTGAVNVFGAALFFLLLLPSQGIASAAALGWPKRLLTISGCLVLWGTLVSLVAQAATMNGAPLNHLDLPSLQLVLTDTRWGHANAIRLALSLVALATTLFLKPDKTLWRTQATLGTLIWAIRMSVAFSRNAAP